MSGAETVIDRRWIGYRLPPSELTIDRTRLRFFAKSVGETDPGYTDLAAAQAAGHPDLPAPPTFIFAAELDSGAIDRLLEQLGIPLDRLLHGEQGFSPMRVVCAGETVTVHSQISDIYARKDGALEFVVKTSRVLDAQGLPVCDMRSTLVCRNPVHEVSA
jgi:hypothetical protein